MLTPNCYTLFFNDSVSDSSLEFDTCKLGLPRPETFQQQRTISHKTHKRVGSTEPKAVPTYTRFPVKPLNKNKVSFVPVLIGLPWSQYKKKYRVRYSYLFAVITSRNASRVAECMATLPNLYYII